MSFFVQPTPAPAPKTVNTKIVSITLAAFFVILAVAQLYSFEEFPDVIASFWLPGSHVLSHVCAALIVTGEVLALPFLLSMRLSPAMRIVSMVAGWAVIAGWLVVSLWINLSVNAVTNSGVLGATISVTPGWWMTGLFLALGVLAGWATWGMSPWQKTNGA
jgi:hypothetical protein